MATSSGFVSPCPGALQGPASQMFLTLINTLMAARCTLGPEGRYPADYGPNLNDGDEFDFIVVGAGSAGSVVANRLSQISQWRILLLEAGGYPSALTEIPALGLSLQDTNEDWQFKMESSPTSCLGLRNEKCRCPRGKGLGGTSLINTLQYTRSTRHDHNTWVQKGNTGWDYASVTRQYKGMENAHIPDEDFGKSGELHLTRYTSTQSVRRILEEAYAEQGHAPYTDDVPIGFRDNLVNIFKGTRQHAAKAFLAPIRDRQNLFVALNAEVSRLLVEDISIVQGVEVKINDKLLKLRAKKEVVLSAGTVNSPRILMHSGIGRREHLSNLGIKPVKDLHVGENLQEHPSFTPLAVTINRAVNEQSSTHDQMYNFLMHREGDLTQVGVTNFQLLLNTQNKTIANVQYFHKVIRQRDQYLLKSVIQAKGFPEDVAKTLTEHNENSPLLLFIPVVLHPKSRGVVRLQSSDPFSAPLITANLWSDESGEDVQTMLDAIKHVQHTLNTKAFAPYNPKIVDLEIANCKGVGLVPQSEEFWRCAIKNIGSTSYHPVGTCKMGPKTDPTAVVDPRLRVHGVKGVRVIDGSIMPETVTGNPNGPIMMIGARGAALIKQDWLKKKEEL